MTSKCARVVHHSPVQLFLGKEGLQYPFSIGVTLGQLPGFTAQSELPLVAWQTIKIGPMKRSKAFQTIQCINALKRLGVELHGRGRREATGTTTRMLFEVGSMGRTVGAQEKTSVPAGGGSQEGQAVLFAL